MTLVLSCVLRVGMSIRFQQGVIFKIVSEATQPWINRAVHWLTAAALNRRKKKDNNNYYMLWDNIKWCRKEEEDGGRHDDDDCCCYCCCCWKGRKIWWSSSFVMMIRWRNKNKKIFEYIKVSRLTRYIKIQSTLSRLLEPSIIIFQKLSLQKVKKYWQTRSEEELNDGLRFIKYDRALPQWPAHQVTLTLTLTLTLTCHKGPREKPEPEP